MNPRPFLDQLTVTVEIAAIRSALREIIALADQAPALTDDQLRFRLCALAECTRSGVIRCPPIPDRPLPAARCRRVVALRT